MECYSYYVPRIESPEVQLTFNRSFLDGLNAEAKDLSHWDRSHWNLDTNWDLSMPFPMFDESPYRKKWVTQLEEAAFEHTASLTDLNFSNWDIRYIWRFNRFFESQHLKSLDISSWNPQVNPDKISAYQMLNCPNLEILDISGIQNEQVMACFLDGACLPNLRHAFVHDERQGDMILRAVKASTTKKIENNAFPCQIHIV